MTTTSYETILTAVGRHISQERAHEINWANFQEKYSWIFLAKIVEHLVFTFLEKNALLFVIE